MPEIQTSYIFNKSTLNYYSEEKILIRKIGWALYPIFIISDHNLLMYRLEEARQTIINFENRWDVDLFNLIYMINRNIETVYYNSNEHDFC